VGHAAKEAGLRSTPLIRQRLSADNAARRGGSVSYVGVPHGVNLDMEKVFFEHVHRAMDERRAIKALLLP
jgi:hypothetical protein